MEKCNNCKFSDCHLCGMSSEDCEKGLCGCKTCYAFVNFEERSE
jgi:hypothetical protein